VSGSNIYKITIHKLNSIALLCDDLQLPFEGMVFSDLPHAIWQFLTNVSLQWLAFCYKVEAYAYYLSMVHLMVLSGTPAIQL
jgi:hypothetical protein